MLDKNLYNGWTNYETWKVQLECLDGYASDREVTIGELQDEAGRILFEGVPHASIAENILWNFLREVDFRELADFHNEQFK